MQVYTAPPGATLAPELRSRIAASAKQFEAMALGPLLEPMFATVDSSKGPFGGGEAEQTWRPMMVTELAKGIAAWHCSTPRTVGWRPGTPKVPPGCSSRSSRRPRRSPRP